MSKILIIDDDETLRLTRVNMLRRKGYESLATANGQDDLRVARAESPDLLLSDVNMPGIDGLEVLRRLRALPAISAISVSFGPGARTVKMSATTDRADLAAPETIRAGDQNQARILIIDDNQAIHADFRKILTRAETAELDRTENALFGSPPPARRKLRFVLDSAFQGEEGLAMVKAGLAAGERYAVALVDVRMPPGWDGLETTAKLWEVDPDLQVVLCSAYSDYGWDQMVERLGQTDNLVILKKPIDSLEVLQLAHTLVKKSSLTRAARQREEDLDRIVRERTRELRTANEKLLQQIAERKQAEAQLELQNAELQTAQEQLRQSQKMDAIGQLAGGVAHDFNNLLAVIRGNSELALIGCGKFNGQAKECLNQVVAAADRAANLTRQLLAFGRKQIMQSQPLSLNAVVANLAKMLKRIIGEDIQLQCVYGDPLPLIEADAGMMEQVLLNLVVNARDAMPHGGQLVITTAALTLNPDRLLENPEARCGHFVKITVRDTGTGIASDHLPRIFEPFFTTKEVGKGTGLGLSTVYGIVKQHQGWVEVSSQVGAGATFKILLPAIEVAVSTVVTKQPGPMPRGGSETLLLVEDDDAVRDCSRRLLERFGYRVREASSGKEALQLWPAHAAEIELLLTDVVMPNGVSGRELAEQLLKQRPELRVIFLTGYSGDAINYNSDFMRQEKIQLLQKPCSSHKLLQTIRQCLDLP